MGYPKPKKCYASLLGNCEGPMSKEHVISHSILKQSNLQFQITNTIVKSNTSIQNLTIKILCKKHNSEISVLDQEISKFLKILKEIADFSNSGNVYPTTKRYQINGKLIERWFLKTLINLNGIHQTLFEYPTEQMVKIVFGQNKFLGSSGLYIRARKGDKVLNPNTGILYAPRFNINRSKSVGASFLIWGFEFLLFFPEGENKLKEEGYMLRLRKFREKTANQELEFIW